MKHLIMVFVLFFSLSSTTYAFDCNAKDLYLGLSIGELREKGIPLEKLAFYNVNNRGRYMEHHKTQANSAFLGIKITSQHYYLFDDKSYIVTSVFPIQEQEAFVSLLKNNFGEPVKIPKNEKGFVYTIYCWENDTVKIELRYIQPNVTSSTMLYITHKPTLNKFNKAKEKKIIPYKNEQKDFGGIKLGMEMEEIKALGYTLETKYKGKETDVITHYAITNKDSDMDGLTAELTCSFFKNKLMEVFIVYKESDGVDFNQIFNKNVDRYGMPTEFIPLSEIACWSGSDNVVFIHNILLMDKSHKKMFSTSIKSKYIETEYKKFKQNK